MSKRVRGTVRAHRRPGTRPPSDRPPTKRREQTAPRVSQLETAAVLAEEIVEEPEVLAETPRAPVRAEAQPLARGTRVHHKIKAGSVLAERAATEYVYVAQDMRRILIVSGVLVGILFALWLLLVVLRVVELPFY